MGEEKYTAGQVIGVILQADGEPVQARRTGRPGQPRDGGNNGKTEASGTCRKEYIMDAPCCACGGKTDWRGTTWATK